MNLFQAKEFSIIAFNSTAHAMEAEKHMEGKNIPFLLIPLPTGVKATCGLSLKCSWEDYGKAKDILKEAHIPYAGSYYVIREGGQQIVTTIEE